MIPGMINTATVNGRRIVRLESLADYAAEVERLDHAARAGQVHPLGNWTPAQVFEHLAIVLAGALDGFSFQYPWHWRVASRVTGWLSWRWLLRLAFRPGFLNPPAASALEPPPDVHLDDAINRLRHVLARVLRGERMGQRSPTGELLTHDQWVDCQLRHAELHLSFLRLC